MTTRNGQYSGGRPNRPLYSEDDGDELRPATSYAITVRTHCRLDGAPLDLSATLDVRRVQGLLAYLKRLGADFPSEPLRYELTPDGRPICPKHAVAMTKHGKGTDTWYSHGVTVADGRKLWCKGYPGADSLGFFEMPAVPIDPREGDDDGHPSAPG